MDADFSALLAVTQAIGPSIVQLRTLDVLPDTAGAMVIRVIAAHQAALEDGAIVSVDDLTSRVRVLPIRRRSR